MRLEGLNPRPNFTLLLFHLFLSFFHLVTTYTEVFSIVKTSTDISYAVGNHGSNFYIESRNSSCALLWNSTAGSTTGDDNNGENSEILYSAILGSDNLLYAVGITRGKFSDPIEESINQDVAVVVYNPSDGSVVRQQQYDIPSGTDNTASAVAQKDDGNVLIAVHGSYGSVLQETRILEIDSNTLETLEIYSIEVVTSPPIVITGGPVLVSMVYESESNSIVALGHIISLGVLFRFSLDTATVTSQAEWGSLFGSVIINDFISDGAGSYFVVGSSSDVILQNSDMSSGISTELRAYVIRFDNLNETTTSPTWVRQLNSDTTSDLRGKSVTIDPSSREIVVAGQYSGSLTVSDSQTSVSYQISAVSSNGQQDIFLWRLDPVTANFNEIKSAVMSNPDERDEIEAVNVLSNSVVLVGGALNNGDDSLAVSCNISTESPSPSFSAFSPQTAFQTMTFSASASSTGISSPKVPSSPSTLVASHTVTPSAILIGPTPSPSQEASVSLTASVISFGSTSTSSFSGLPSISALELSSTPSESSTTMASSSTLHSNFSTSPFTSIGWTETPGVSFTKFTAPVESTGSPSATFPNLSTLPTISTTYTITPTASLSSFTASSSDPVGPTLTPSSLFSGYFVSSTLVAFSATSLPPSTSFTASPSISGSTVSPAEIISSSTLSPSIVFSSSATPSMSFSSYSVLPSNLVGPTITPSVSLPSYRATPLNSAENTNNPSALFPDYVSLPSSSVRPSTTPSVSFMTYTNSPSVSIAPTISPETSFSSFTTLEVLPIKRATISASGSIGGTIQSSLLFSGSIAPSPKPSKPFFEPSFSFPSDAVPILASEPLIFASFSGITGAPPPITKPPYIHLLPSFVADELLGNSVGPIFTPLNPTEDSTDTMIPSEMTSDFMEKSLRPDNTFEPSVPNDVSSASLKYSPGAIISQGLMRPSSIPTPFSESTLPEESFSESISTIFGIPSLTDEVYPQKSLSMSFTDLVSSTTSPLASEDISRVILQSTNPTPVSALDISTSPSRMGLPTITPISSTTISILPTVPSYSPTPVSALLISISPSALGLPSITPISTGTSVQPFRTQSNSPSPLSALHVSVFPSQLNLPSITPIGMTATASFATQSFSLVSVSVYQTLVSPFQTDLWEVFPSRTETPAITLTFHSASQSEIPTTSLVAAVSVSRTPASFKASTDITPTLPYSVSTLPILSETMSTKPVSALDISTSFSPGSFTALPLLTEVPSGNLELDSTASSSVRNPEIPKESPDTKLIIPSLTSHLPAASESQTDMLRSDEVNSDKKTMALEKPYFPPTSSFSINTGGDENNRPNATFTWVTYTSDGGLYGAEVSVLESLLPSKLDDESNNDPGKQNPAPIFRTIPQESLLVSELPSENIGQATADKSFSSHETTLPENFEGSQFTTGTLSAYPTHVIELFASSEKETTTELKFQFSREAENRVAVDSLLPFSSDAQFSGPIPSPTVSMSVLEKEDVFSHTTDTFSESLFEIIEVPGAADEFPDNSASVVPLYASLQESIVTKATKEASFLYQVSPSTCVTPSNEPVFNIVSEADLSPSSTEKDVLFETQGMFSSILPVQRSDEYLSPEVSTVPHNISESISSGSRSYYPSPVNPRVRSTREAELSTDPLTYMTQIYVLPTDEGLDSFAEFTVYAQTTHSFTSPKQEFAPSLATSIFEDSESKETVFPYAPTMPLLISGGVGTFTKTHKPTSTESIIGDNSMATPTRSIVQSLMDLFPSSELALPTFKSPVFEYTPVSKPSEHTADDIKGATEYGSPFMEAVLTSPFVTLNSLEETTVWNLNQSPISLQLEASSTPTPLIQSKPTASRIYESPINSFTPAFKKSFSSEAFVVNGEDRISPTSELYFTTISGIFSSEAYSSTFGTRADVQATTDAFLTESMTSESFTYSQRLSIISFDVYSSFEPIESGIVDIVQSPTLNSLSYPTSEAIETTVVTSPSFFSKETIFLKTAEIFPSVLKTPAPPRKPPRTGEVVPSDSVEPKFLFTTKILPSILDMLEQSRDPFRTSDAAFSTSSNPYSTPILVPSLIDLATETPLPPAPSDIIQTSNIFSGQIFLSKTPHVGPSDEIHAGFSLQGMKTSLPSASDISSQPPQTTFELVNPSRTESMEFVTPSGSESEYYSKDFNSLTPDKTRASPKAIAIESLDISPENSLLPYPVEPSSSPPFFSGAFTILPSEPSFKFYESKFTSSPGFSYFQSEVAIPSLTLSVPPIISKDEYSIPSAPAGLTNPRDVGESKAPASPLVLLLESSTASESTLDEVNASYSEKIDTIPSLVGPAGLESPSSVSFEPTETEKEVQTSEKVHMFSPYLQTITDTPETSPQETLPVAHLPGPTFISSATFSAFPYEVGFTVLSPFETLGIVESRTFEPTLQATERPKFEDSAAEQSVFTSYTSEVIESQQYYLSTGASTTIDTAKGSHIPAASVSFDFREIQPSAIVSSTNIPETFMMTLSHDASSFHTPSIGQVQLQNSQPPVEISQLPVEISQLLADNIFDPYERGHVTANFSFDQFPDKSVIYSLLFSSSPEKVMPSAESLLTPPLISGGTFDVESITPTYASTREVKQLVSVSLETSVQALRSASKLTEESSNFLEQTGRARASLGELLHTQSATVEVLQSEAVIPLPLESLQTTEYNSSMPELLQVSETGELEAIPTFNFVTETPFSYSPIFLTSALPTILPSKLDEPSHIATLEPLLSENSVMPSKKQVATEETSVLQSISESPQITEIISITEISEVSYSMDEGMMTDGFKSSESLVSLSASLIPSFKELASSMAGINPARVTPQERSPTIQGSISLLTSEIFVSLPIESEEPSISFFKHIPVELSPGPETAKLSATPEIATKQFPEISLTSTALESQPFDTILYSTIFEPQLDEVSATPKAYEAEFGNVSISPALFSMGDTYTSSSPTDFERIADTGYVPSASLLPESSEFPSRPTKSNFELFDLSASKALPTFTSAIFDSGNSISKQSTEILPTLFTVVPSFSKTSEAQPQRTVITTPSIPIDSFDLFSTPESSLASTPAFLSSSSLTPLDDMMVTPTEPSENRTSSQDPFMETSYAMKTSDLTVTESHSASYSTTSFLASPTLLILSDVLGTPLQSKSGSQQTTQAFAGFSFSPDMFVSPMDLSSLKASQSTESKVSETPFISTNQFFLQSSESGIPLPISSEGLTPLISGENPSKTFDQIDENTLVSPHDFISPLTPQVSASPLIFENLDISPSSFGAGSMPAILSSIAVSSLPESSLKSSMPTSPTIEADLSIESTESMTTLDPTVPLASAPTPQKAQVSAVFPTTESVFESPFPVEPTISILIAVPRSQSPPPTADTSMVLSGGKTPVPSREVNIGEDSSISPRAPKVSFQGPEGISPTRSYHRMGTTEGSTAPFEIATQESFPTITDSRGGDFPSPQSQIITESPSRKFSGSPSPSRHIFSVITESASEVPTPDYFVKGTFSGIVSVSAFTNFTPDGVAVPTMAFLGDQSPLLDYSFSPIRSKNAEPEQSSTSTEPQGLAMISPFRYDAVAVSSDAESSPLLLPSPTFIPQSLTTLPGATLSFATSPGLGIVFETQGILLPDQSSTFSETKIPMTKSPKSDNEYETPRAPLGETEHTPLLVSENSMKPFADRTPSSSDDQNFQGAGSDGPLQSPKWTRQSGGKAPELSHGFPVTVFPSSTQGLFTEIPSAQLYHETDKSPRMSLEMIPTKTLESFPFATILKSAVPTAITSPDKIQDTSLQESMGPTPTMGFNGDTKRVSAMTGSIEIPGASTQPMYTSFAETPSLKETDYSVKFSEDIFITLPVSLILEAPKSLAPISYSEAVALPSFGVETFIHRSPFTSVSPDTSSTEMVTPILSHQIGGTTQPIQLQESSSLMPYYPSIFSLTLMPSIGFRTHDILYTVEPTLPPLFSTRTPGRADTHTLEASPNIPFPLHQSTVSAGTLPSTTPNFLMTEPVFTTQQFETLASFSSEGHFPEGSYGSSDIFIERTGIPSMPDITLYLLVTDKALLTLKVETPEMTGSMQFEKNTLKSTKVVNPTSVASIDFTFSNMDVSISQAPEPYVTTAGPYIHQSLRSSPLKNFEIEASAIVDSPEVTIESTGDFMYVLPTIGTVKLTIEATLGLKSETSTENPSENLTVDGTSTIPPAVTEEAMQTFHEMIGETARSPLATLDTYVQPSAELTMNIAFTPDQRLSSTQPNQTVMEKATTEAAHPSFFENTVKASINILVPSASSEPVVSASKDTQQTYLPAYSIPKKLTSGDIEIELTDKTASPPKLTVQSGAEDVTPFELMEISPQAGVTYSEPRTGSPGHSEISYVRPSDEMLDSSALPTQKVPLLVFTPAVQKSELGNRSPAIFIESPITTEQLPNIGIVPTPSARQSDLLGSDSSFEKSPDSSNRPPRKTPLISSKQSISFSTMLYPPSTFSPSETPVLPSTIGTMPLPSGALSPIIPPFISLDSESILPSEASPLMSSIPSPSGLPATIASSHLRTLASSFSPSPSTSLTPLFSTTIVHSTAFTQSLAPTQAKSMTPPITFSPLPPPQYSASVSPLSPSRGYLNNSLFPTSTPTYSPNPSSTETISSSQTAIPWSLGPTSSISSSFYNSPSIILNQSNGTSTGTASSFTELPETHSVSISVTSTQTLTATQGFKESTSASLPVTPSRSPLALISPTLTISPTVYITSTSTSPTSSPATTASTLPYSPPSFSLYASPTTSISDARATTTPITFSSIAPSTIPTAMLFSATPSTRISPADSTSAIFTASPFSILPFPTEPSTSTTVLSSVSFSASPNTIAPLPSITSLVSVSATATAFITSGMTTTTSASSVMTSPIAIATQVPSATSSVLYQASGAILPSVSFSISPTSYIASYSGSPRQSLTPTLTSPSASFTIGQGKVTASISSSLKPSDMVMPLATSPLIFLSESSTATEPLMANTPALLATTLLVPLTTIEQEKITIEATHGNMISPEDPVALMTKGTDEPWLSLAPSMASVIEISEEPSESFLVSILFGGVTIEFSPLSPAITTEHLDPSANMSPQAGFAATTLDISNSLEPSPMIGKPPLRTKLESVSTKPESQLSTPTGYSVSPTKSSGTSAATPSASASPSPSQCLDPSLIITNISTLETTNYFQRVMVTLKISGPELVTTCELTPDIVEKVYEVAAANTLSDPQLWVLTSVEEGPFVVASTPNSLVGIGGNNETTIGSPSLSASAAINESSEIEILFAGSVIIESVVFMDALSVKLAKGSFKTYVNSQGMVRTLRRSGFQKIHWASMVGKAELLDGERTEQPEPELPSRTSGSVAAVAVGTFMMLGMAGVMMVDAGMIATSNARAPGTENLPV